MNDLASLRRDYSLTSLDESEVAMDPLEQFDRWFSEAQRAGVSEPNAMTLATASADGTPSARTVLLKGFDPRGFIFFTSYESQKGVELTANPKASLVFFWQPLERQVLISGEVTRLDRSESEAYFHQRPRLSQLGAWASLQSRAVASRAALEQRFVEVEARFVGQEILCPPSWGGFVLAPVRIEFWQGRPNRLHDRIRYLHGEQGWSIGRIYP